ncbi:MAG TPA: M81 family metallopeptidase [Kofleriaceae bacterium]|nr:M81 family metallopeptidase [Kofleriaceae bacterium]
MTLRIAFARVCQESNALSPVPTTMEDFTASHFVEGPALLDACSPGGREVPGFFRRAELAGFVAAARARSGEVEPVPILSAWASSGGPLSQACFDGITARLEDGLRAAGRIDGVFLALHGAMGVHGVRDPDTRLLRAARAAAGGAPVVCTHDLHGNLTRARVEAADAIVAYGTNPHRDHARAGRRAGDILIGLLRRELRPTTAWRSLPMILGGGKTIDFLSPMRRVFRRMRAAERRGEALAASTFMVHPWNDEPELGWSTLVVTHDDPGGADALAEELAEMVWARRHQQPPTFAGASEAIARARGATLARRLGVVTMSDASDVVTAGAPGDSTHLLRALLAEGQGMLCYAAVRDPAAVAALWPRAPGDEVDLEVGGRLDPQSSSPLPVRGRLLGSHHRPGFERMVVLELGDVRLVVTEGPAMVMKPSFYRDVGLDPWKADVIMVKNFFPFLLFFLPMNRKTIFVRTRGVTDFDAAFRLTFDGPVHPRDEVADWRGRDRMRRGVP